MIPQQRIQPLATGVAFLGAKASADIGPLLDREDGGIALQDPSEGLLYQAWSARIVGGTQIVITPASGGDTIWITGSEITECSLAFDQNMTPVIAYVEAGIAKLNWFDVTVNMQVTNVYDDTYKNPRVSLDDKHKLASSTSDVIIAYLRDGNLYYRQQRDRYLTEYLLESVMENRILQKIGMNISNRFQFQIADRIR